MAISTKAPTTALAFEVSSHRPKALPSSPPEARNAAENREKIPTPTRQKSAEVARDRLQIIIAQERVKSQAPDYLPTLQKELLEVLSKYVNVSLDDIRISQEKQDGLDVLELNITLPDQPKRA